MHSGLEAAAAEIDAAHRPLTALIACDIGGTNSRVVVRVLSKTGDTVAQVAHVGRAKSARALIAQLAELEAAISGLEITVTGAALAICGPVIAGATVPVRSGWFSVAVVSTYKYAHSVHSVLRPF